MPMDRKAIDEILCKMRDAIDQKNFFAEDRKKNLKTLAILGYTKEAMLDEIYELTVGDYQSGPCPDRDNPKDDPYWMFKKVIGGEVIYIKFKIRESEGGRAHFTSYHIDFM